DALCHYSHRPGVHAQRATRTQNSPRRNRDERVEYRDESMSFFSDMKAERLIAEIRGIGDPLNPEAQKAFHKLRKIAPRGIPKIPHALAVADKKETASYVEILAQMVDTKTFPMLVEGLVDGSPRTVAAVTWALIASRNYAPSLLIELLNREDIAKPAVLEII